MEASNTEIAQRKLRPGSLQSALCTLFFLRLLQSWWLSDNRRHMMKAVWSVLGCRTVSLSSKPAGRERQGQIEFCSLHSCSITAAQCVELSLSNVSTWMGDHQRKHCVQLPGEEIRGIFVRDFALSSWGTQWEKAHGDTIERPYGWTGVRMTINI